MDPPTAIDSAVGHLGDEKNARPASTFPVGHADVDLPGLYSWWVDDAGRRALGTVFDTELPGLIYGGQAGASSSRAGVERSATLKSRIRGNHLRGNISSSTFRKTLSAVLFIPLDLRLERPGKLDAMSNRAVTSWIHTHLRVATFGWKDRSSLAALEDDVLKRLDPPLNLMGMSPSPVRSRLKVLRRQLT
ncbi:GIY-YIG nuclease family protein [Actinomarinicola tropica]|uniref:GIY-YIG catalytic domain-containing protein n=1 Tax=Actinomarinicola tropica TaxID=2789776 RepID=A0A5Q2RFG2_9ACTN|nr:hypothetical protein [Actinomarinicola tropica]QGG94374.1 hypothetical protein GH723_04235 [Actinomarinicola tropica]